MVFGLVFVLWSQLTPGGDQWTEARRESILQSFVYDTDSALAVGLGFERLAIYDGEEDSWEIRSHQHTGEVLGLAYHPPSGLVVTTIDGSLWAYDVETDAWTEIGEPSFGTEWVELLGYVESIDRFLFVATGMTALVDPRSGETTEIFTESPTVDLGWPSAQYGSANGTIYVTSHAANGVLLCAFNPAKLGWDCYDPSGELNSGTSAFGAIVDDPIHDRVLMIHRIFGDWWVNSEGAVWSLDPNTGA